MPQESAISPDIAAHRLPEAAYQANFADLHPPLDQHANPDDSASKSDGSADHGVLRPSARSVARNTTYSVASAQHVPSTRDEYSGGIPTSIRRTGTSTPTSPR